MSCDSSISVFIARISDSQQTCLISCRLANPGSQNRAWPAEYRLTHLGRHLNTGKLGIPSSWRPSSSSLRLYLYFVILRLCTPKAVPVRDGRPILSRHCRCIRYKALRGEDRMILLRPSTTTTFRASLPAYRFLTQHKAQTSSTCSRSSDDDPEVKMVSH